MPKLPSFIRFMSERIGKPSSDFTKADWQRVAMSASETVDKLWGELHPPKKKRGRPKNYLRGIIGRRQMAVKGSRGRPKSDDYYGLTAEEFLSRVENWMAAPGGPKTKNDAIRKISKIYNDAFTARGIPTGHQGIDAISRALRREKKRKADKNKNKKKPISR